MAEALVRSWKEMTARAERIEHVRVLGPEDGEVYFVTETFSDGASAKSWRDANGHQLALAEPTLSWQPWERIWLRMQRREQISHPLVVFANPLTGRVERMFVWTYAAKRLADRLRDRRHQRRLPRARVVKALP